MAITLTVAEQKKILEQKVTKLKKVINQYSYQVLWWALGR
jgi:hypothetical protein